jgi:hypothetical protein
MANVELYLWQHHLACALYYKNLLGGGEELKSFSLSCHSKIMKNKNKNTDNLSFNL